MAMVLTSFRDRRANAVAGRQSLHNKIKTQVESTGKWCPQGPQGGLGEGKQRGNPKIIGREKASILDGCFDIRMEVFKALIGDYYRLTSTRERGASS